jgi:hypothetical protein
MPHPLCRLGRVSSRNAPAAPTVSSSATGTLATSAGAVAETLSALRILGTAAVTGSNVPLDSHAARRFLAVVMRIRVSAALRRQPDAV